MLGLSHHASHKRPPHPKSALEQGILAGSDSKWYPPRPSFPMAPPAHVVSPPVPIAVAVAPPPPGYPLATALAQVPLSVVLAPSPLFPPAMNPAA